MPTTSAPATTIAAPTTTSTTAAPDVLRPGATGDAVVALQRRLVELGFFVIALDGAYDEVTAHAVTAFQKVTGLRRDGIAGPQTLGALAAATRPAPGAETETTGLAIEVDLTRQVLLVARDGTTELVLDVSTGRDDRTPTGHYRIEREIDGYHRSELGVLYRPKYVYRGIAVHGYPSVPPYPASHGCIRTINPAMDHLWANDLLPIGTPVWVHR